METVPVEFHNKKPTVSDESPFVNVSNILLSMDILDQYDHNEQDPFEVENGCPDSNLSVFLQNHHLLDLVSPKASHTHQIDETPQTLICASSENPPADAAPNSLPRCATGGSECWPPPAAAPPSNPNAPDGITPTDSYLSAGETHPAQPSPETPRITAHNNVYMSELPAHWNTEKLRSVCAAFGGIVSAKVARDATSNKSREYGFVMFETAEQAAACVRALHTCVVEGRTLVCRFAHEKAMPSFAHSDLAGSAVSTPPNAALAGRAASKAAPSPTSANANGQADPHAASETHRNSSSSNETGEARAVAGVRRSCNVFIQGLPLQWNTDKLRGLCSTCGKVLLAKVVRDATTSLSCGHGFVLFEREEQAALCVSTLNRRVMEGRLLTCRLAREKKNSPVTLPQTQPAQIQSQHGQQRPPRPSASASGAMGAPKFVETVSFMPMGTLKPPVVSNAPSFMGNAQTAAALLSPTVGVIPTNGPMTSYPMSLLVAKHARGTPALEYGVASNETHMAASSVPSFPGTYVVALPYPTAGW